MVWMRVAGQGTFKKVWGIIDQALKPGTYLIEIENSKLLNKCVPC